MIQCQNQTIIQQNFYQKIYYQKNEKYPQISINRSVYLGLLILGISKIQIWYVYMEPKYQQKAKLCHIDTDRLIVYINTKDIQADFRKDVTAKFNPSNYELERQLPTRKNKKSI